VGIPVGHESPRSAFLCCSAGGLEGWSWACRGWRSVRVCGEGSAVLCDVWCVKRGGGGQRQRGTEAQRAVKWLVLEDDRQARDGQVVTSGPRSSPPYEYCMYSSVCLVQGSLQGGRRPTGRRRYQLAGRDETLPTIEDKDGYLVIAARDATRLGFRRTAVRKNG
jgi:hypothetical protein